MKSKIVFISLFLLLIFLIPISAINAGTCRRGTETAGSCSTVSDCDTGYECYISSTGGSDGTVSLTNPLGTGAENTSIPVLLGKIISSVLGIVGSLALVMFIYGGVTWMLSVGNQEQIIQMPAVSRVLGGERFLAGRLVHPDIVPRGIEAAIRLPDPLEGIRLDQLEPIKLHVPAHQVQDVTRELEHRHAAHRRVHQQAASDAAQTEPAHEDIAVSAEHEIHVLQQLRRRVLHHRFARVFLEVDRRQGLSAERRVDPARHDAAIDVRHGVALVPASN